MQDSNLIKSNKDSPNLQNTIFSMDRKKGIGGEYLLEWIGEEMQERGLRGGEEEAAGAPVL
jgi:hypothetical protein